jgi:hypothetical protein
MAPQREEAFRLAQFWTAFCASALNGTRLPTAPEWLAWWQGVLRAWPDDRAALDPLTVGPVYTPPERPADLEEQGEWTQEPWVPALIARLEDDVLTSRRWPAATSPHQVDARAAARLPALGALWEARFQTPPPTTVPLPAWPLLAALQAYPGPVDWERWATLTKGERHPAIRLLGLGGIPLAEALSHHASMPDVFRPRAATGAPLAWRSEILMASTVRFRPTAHLAWLQAHGAPLWPRRGYWEESVAPTPTPDLPLTFPLSSPPSPDRPSARPPLRRELTLSHYTTVTDLRDALNQGLRPWGKVAVESGWDWLLRPSTGTGCLAPVPDATVLAMADLLRDTRLAAGRRRDARQGRDWVMAWALAGQRYALAERLGWTARRNAEAPLLLHRGPPGRSHPQWMGWLVRQWSRGAWLNEPPSPEATARLQAIVQGQIEAVFRPLGVSPHAGDLHAGRLTVEQGLTVHTRAQGFQPRPGDPEIGVDRDPTLPGWNGVADMWEDRAPLWVWWNSVAAHLPPAAIPAPVRDGLAHLAPDPLARWTAWLTVQTQIRRTAPHMHWSALPTHLDAPEGSPLSLAPQALWESPTGQDWLTTVASHATGLEGPAVHTVVEHLQRYPSLVSLHLPWAFREAVHHHAQAVRNGGEAETAFLHTWQPLLMRGLDQWLRHAPPPLSDLEVALEAQAQSPLVAPLVAHLHRHRIVQQQPAAPPRRRPGLRG